jgi:hypothetical protein
MSVGARRISKFAASLLLALYGLMFLAVGAPSLVVKVIFSVIGLFYFLASFGIMRNRLWGFYTSTLISIPVILIGFLRIREVLVLSGTVDQGALYLFVMPSMLICACSIWMAVTKRRLKSVQEIEVGTDRRRFLKYAVATVAVAGAIVLGLYSIFNPTRPKPSEIVSVASSTSTTISKSSRSTGTSTTTTVFSASSTSRTTTRPQEVDVGLLLVPVDFDGHVSPGEYDKDTIDYRYWGSPVPEGHLHVKNDGTWTFFGIEFLGDEETNKPYKRVFSIWFDTQNTGKQERNIPGVYTFDIQFSDPKKPVEFSEMAKAGIPFMNAFVRGSDYDWKYYFEEGTQLEIKIKTEILRKHSNEIGIASTFVGPNSNLVSSDIPYRMWVPMKFKDTPLSESSDALLIGGLIGATALGSKLYGHKIRKTVCY